MDVRGGFPALPPVQGSAGASGIVGKHKLETLVQGAGQQGGLAQAGMSCHRHGILVDFRAGRRRFREAVGRLNCLLAESAETVERVCCGLGMRLK